MRRACINNIGSILFFFLLCLVSTVALAGTGDLSPIDFGLYQAKNGVERYECLYRTHCAAIEAGVNVTYKGIDSLFIEIPKGGKGIPLTDNNDFGGLVLTVRNNAKTHFVFWMIQPATDIQVSKEVVVAGNYSGFRELSKGNVVLVLSDNTPWVYNRRGYEYGAIRKDIVCLKDGIPQNKVVTGYDTASSVPSVSYFIPSSHKKKISNITFIREPGNTMRAYLLRIENQSNVEVSNVRCETPPSDITGDMIIRVNDCANISFKDVVIHGSYSQLKKSGYGISMNNVYNVSFYRLVANANWGIFGNNNVNNVKLKDCDINRFDVHCYGRDVYFDRCKFRNLYNQFSSMYGTVSFRKCEFFDFTPVLFEPSYNAYTRFDLKFKNCIIHASKNKDFLINAGELTGSRTRGRSELAVQHFPNLYIDGLKIDMAEGVDTYYLYNFRKNILIAPDVEGVKKVRRVKFISKREGLSIKMVDTRNQQTLMSIGGIFLLGGGLTSLYAFYGRKAKAKKNTLSK